MRSLLHAPRSRKRSIAAATLGALALVGSLLVATPAQALNDTGTGGVFVPTTGRILDTKNNIGGYSTPMPAKAWRTVQVTGTAGLPDDGTVGAVSVVATVADIPGQGQLFGRPDSNTSQTLMGIYGGEAKQNTSFSSVLAVSSDGTVQVYAETSVRLILDVQGYYTADTDGTAPGGFVPSNGKRVADSRSGTGIPKAQLTSGKSATLQVTGTAGVPAGASAVIVNLIALNSASSVGYLTPYATGATRPANSFNYAGDVITTMQAQVPLSADGKITVYNANSTIDLAIDVQGYFTAAGKSGAAFTPGQGRIVDTRNTGGNLAGNETRAYDVAGKAGVPIMGSGVNAVVLTLTSIATNGGGWGRVWANGTTEPDTASLRYEDGTIRTNTITVPLGANGKINLHNIGAGATNFVIDVQGWYANPLAPTITCPTPYVSDAWIQNVPTSAVNCTVTAAAATSSTEQLQVMVDDQDPIILALSSTGPTSQKVQVPAVRGTHMIVADRLLDEDVFTEATYGFTFGRWTDAEITSEPSTGDVTHLKPYLSAFPAGDDQFPEDASFRYLLSNAVTGDAVWDSGSTTAPYVEVTDPLITGTTYAWHAEVTGSVDSAGTQATLVTATSTFTASDHAAGEDAAATTGADGTWTAAAVDAGDEFTPDKSSSQIGVSRKFDPVPYCKPKDNTSKTVRDYERKAFPGVVKKGGIGKLICGTPGGLGMRHVWAGHGPDWIKVVNKYPIGLSAESFMDQSINTTLRRPSNVIYNSEKDTYTYQGPVQIKEKGKVVRTYTIKVGHAAGSWKIITAFPS